MVSVGQVKILDDGHCDWDSIGTTNNPTKNRFKFLSCSKVQNEEIIEIFGYPDEGYDFFVWAQVLPNGPANGYRIPKYTKKVYVYLNQNSQIVISMYPKV